MFRKKIETEGLDAQEATISVAAEEGYEIKAEQIEELRNQENEAITEEELGKVAGGTSALGLVTGTISLAATVKLSPEIIVDIVDAIRN